ncbi:hypothetical protein [Sphingopyxis fribergensis]|uniref:hypothetical protein n=1 Tax=Sphingopyxis fribergensis TaxID=1515612 RepID=UPI001E2E9F26|nr:hypothetical protein [Sphingopyxis fribergensis]
MDNPHLSSSKRGRVSEAMEQMEAFIHFRRNGVPRVPSINQLTEWSDLLGNMRESLAAFVNVRDQFPQSMKLIDPKLDGLTPMTITITKAQFITAEMLVSGPAEEQASA